MTDSTEQAIISKQNKLGKSSFKKSNSSRKHKKSVKFNENEQSETESDSNNEIVNLKAVNGMMHIIEYIHSII